MSGGDRRSFQLVGIQARGTIPSLAKAAAFERGADPGLAEAFTAARQDERRTTAFRGREPAVSLKHEYDDRGGCLPPLMVVVLRH